MTRTHRLKEQYHFFFRLVLIFQETAEHANKLSLLSIEITNLLVEVERLGELGEVQQAMSKTEEVDKLKERKSNYI